MRLGVTLLLIALIGFCMAQTATNFEKIEEFKTHKTIKGTLLDYSSETRKRFLGSSRFQFRTTQHYIRLNEFQTVFNIGDVSEPAFAGKAFSKIDIGTEIFLKVRDDFNPLIERSIAPSMVWTKNKKYIDGKVRDQKRKENGLLAIVGVLAFTFGLIHHLRKPWI